MTKRISTSPAAVARKKRSYGSKKNAPSVEVRVATGDAGARLRKGPAAMPPAVRALGASAAGFLYKGNQFASVKDVLNPAIPTKSGKDLSILELRRLTLRRLTLDKHFIPFLMLGIEGEITRKRALEEVKALSYVGRHLIELDQSYLAATLRQHREAK